MDKIMMAHGSGGRLSHELVTKLFKKHLTNPYLDQMNDAAIVQSNGEKIAMSTDSFVISPLFFKGGNIGKLSVCGTVNDLAVSGAKPQFLSLGLILEEGFPLNDLELIIESIAQTARQAGVQIVCGDTKVVERGNADGIFINTTGIGQIKVEVSPSKIKPGDVIIVSGEIGNHGISILSEREGIEFQTPVESDCAPLNTLIDHFYTSGVKCMRDPTRGGVATTLNELAFQAGVQMVIKEEAIPLNPGVKAGAEMLGLDPLYLANEGKLLVVVEPGKADEVLLKMRSHEFGKDAACIGEVEAGRPGLVLLETVLGAKRIIGMLEGEHLPRIC